MAFLRYGVANTSAQLAKDWNTPSSTINYFYLVLILGGTNSNKNKILNKYF